MSVTLFANGVVITDAMATRLNAMSGAVFLSWYEAANNGAQPPGWPDPASRKALAEWGIKRLARNKLESWERKQAEAALETDPWSGGDVEML